MCKGCNDHSGNLQLQMPQRDTEGEMTDHSAQGQETLFGLKSVILSGLLSKGHVPIVGVVRCEDGRSDECEFYHCAEGWFLHMLTNPSLRPSNMSKGENWEAIFWDTIVPLFPS